MSKYLRISVRFLNAEFHGRGDDGEPEWPPSPLRLFQALTNVAARLDGDGISEKKASALRWLETLKQPPEVFAQEATPTEGYQLYVPDNVADLVAKKWTAGKYFDNKNHPIDISGYRTEKRVQPLRLSGDAAVHYAWAFDDADVGEHWETLIAIARAITCLGWGVDLVVTDAAWEESTDAATNFSGERWVPVETSGGVSLRIPMGGTLDALQKRHTAFLNRIRPLDDGGQVFAPVPSLEAFRKITYRRDTELDHPPYAIFALRELDDSKFKSFDAQWRRLHLTGMLRHTASRPDFAAALGWDEKKVANFVLGHDTSVPNNSRPTTNAPRLVFIPLPSIEWRGKSNGKSIGLIRRVMVTVKGTCNSTEFHRILRALEGRELIDEKANRPIAFLRRQSNRENAIADYFAKSSVWTTVTPVVLPGHDDPRKLRRRLSDTKIPISAAEKEQIIRKLDARTERLLRKAFIDSGFPPSLVADADFQWRGGGFLPDVELASRYSAPNQCRRFRRLHVRIVWREQTTDGGFQPKKISGPFCVGSGRFSGLGLFAPVED
jgi:CRISPR-associated protein Csb2